MWKQMPESPIHVAIDPSISINNPQGCENASKEPASASILVRLHAGYFTVCLSFGAQVLLWKNISEHVNATEAIHTLLHTQTLPSFTFLLLYWLSFCTLILLSSLFILRCIFHFQLVRAEFSNHTGVNFLFIPWISWLILLQGPLMKNFPRQILWWIFVVPVVILDTKIYGQWFTTEKRFLSVVANPISQLSVIGNLVVAWAAGGMGWKESALCTFTLGLAHYLVVFITLYQRISGSNSLPGMLRPAFFLFVAAPSTASLAWRSISGSFGLPCKMLFFLSLFLFTSLITRPMLFKKSMQRFSVTWWAYSFPLTLLALASAEYAQEVKGVAALPLMLVLSALSIFVFLGMMLLTALNIDKLLWGNDPCLTFAAAADAC